MKRPAVVPGSWLSTLACSSGLLLLLCLDKGGLGGCALRVGEAGRQGVGEAGGGVCEVPGLPLHREAGGDGAGPGGGQGDGLGVGRGRQGQPGPLPLTGGRGVSCQVRCQVRCQVKCWMSCNVCGS